MTKKVPKKILRIERNFFVNLRKNCFCPLTSRRRRRRFFWTGGATPPPTEIDQRAAADTMTSAHSSSLELTNTLCSLHGDVTSFNRTTAIFSSLATHANNNVRLDLAILDNTATVYCRQPRNSTAVSSFMFVVFDDV